MKATFDRAYTQWLAFRNTPQISRLPDPALHCTTPAFAAICSLGKDALPLLMEKMASGDFFSLQAVEQIIKKAPRDPHLFPLALNGRELQQSEQERSLLTVEKWLG